MQTKSVITDDAGHALAVMIAMATVVAVPCAAALIHSLLG